MDRDLSQAIALFDELRALPAKQRETRLRSQSAAVADHARKLLAAGDREGILDGAAPSLAEADGPAPGSLAAGNEVGPFTIDAPIGLGGMGEVYRAHRSRADFTQRVALKLLRIDAVPDAALFARERRLLAQLDDPGIARFIDGGITSDGRPWMAMEHIEGMPLDRWLAQRRPELATRLRLFVEIAAAVSHAHAKLIVHSDLKPSNILIDAQGRPHLVDFGIARLLEEGGDGAATTRALLTPDYAAPEQFENAGVTTATDIHALGAILFELLTGRRPWQGGGALPAVVRRIVADDPPLPSRVVAGEAAPPVPAAKLKGDLDAIVAKAMRKRPEERYGTVAAMADDVERALTLRPVLARAGSRRYHTQRFVRRNRLALAAGAAVLLAVLAGTIGVAVQARRAGIERDLALAEAKRSDSIVQTLTLMLGQSAGTPDLTLKQALDQAALRMLTTLDRSERSAETLHALGELFVNMQNPTSANALFQGALDRGIGADSPVWTARTKARLADTLVALGRGDDAPRLLDEADRVFATDPERYAADHQEVVITRAGIARRKADYDTAIGLLSADLPAVEQALAAKDNALLTRYNNLLVYMIEANRLADVPALLARIDRVLANPGAADTMQAVGIAQLRAVYLLRREDAAAAERILTEAVDRRRRLFGENAGLASDLTQLAKAQMAQRKFAQAETTLREAVAVTARVLPPTALPAINTRLALVQVEAEQGKLAAARADLQHLTDMKPQPTPPPIGAQYAMTAAVVAVNEQRKDAATAALADARQAFGAMGPAGSYGLTTVATLARRVAALP